MKSTFNICFYAKKDKQKAGGAYPLFWGVSESCQNAQSAAPLCPLPHHFPLKYSKYSCGKMACPGQKFLAAGHFASFQIHPDFVFILYYKILKFASSNRSA